MSLEIILKWKYFEVSFFFGIKFGHIESYLNKLLLSIFMIIAF